MIGQTRALVHTGPRAQVLREVPEPLAAPGKALARVGAPAFTDLRAGRAAASRIRLRP
jgi:hypothetical protein